ncbi:hypothetical protein [Paenibacillus odorifer]|uniref:hypothetical protein n=1 Tax=Paenibacillus odorifer TaxID=189426 RepID=UPI0020BDF453|nr:hypothetical protein [Paenibacillus odorifer]
MQLFLLHCTIVTDRIAAIFAALTIVTDRIAFLLHCAIVTDRIVAILALWSSWREFRTVWLLFP